MPEQRYLFGRRVKRVKVRSDGKSIEALLETRPGERGDWVVFKDLAAYERAVARVFTPAEVGPTVGPDPGGRRIPIQGAFTMTTEQHVRPTRPRPFTGRDLAGHLKEKGLRPAPARNVHLRSALHAMLTQFAGVPVDDRRAIRHTWQIPAQPTASRNACRLGAALTFVPGGQRQRFRPTCGWPAAGSLRDQLASHTLVTDWVPIGDLKAVAFYFGTTVTKNGPFLTPFLRTYRFAVDAVTNRLLVLIQAKFVRLSGQV